VGWFQKSLREFIASYRPQNQLVIHVDCNVYSSTLYCLTMLDQLNTPGTVIVLDDFFDALYVYRAFVGLLLVVPAPVRDRGSYARVGVGRHRYGLSSSWPSG